MDIEEPDSVRTVRLDPDEVTDYVFIKEGEEEEPE